MITYPLTLPGENFRRIEMEMLSAVGRTISPFSFTEQAFAWEGSRWAAGVTLPPLTRTQAEAWIAFLAALRGTEGTFLLGDPFRYTQRGSLDIAETFLGVQINEDAPSGFTVDTRGWTPDATGVLLAGDMFQVGYGEFARMYVVTQDVDADSGGLATIDIWPRWRKDLSAETPAELLTDPGFENWTVGVLDDWQENSHPATTYVEASTTPAPFAGSRYLEMVKTDTEFASIAENGLTLAPGMPYRYDIRRGKSTSDSLSTIRHAMNNNTANERLITKRFAQDAVSVDGDIWETKDVAMTALVDGLVADTWYRTQFGVYIPTRFGAADGYGFSLNTVAGSGVNVYWDAASLYGPTFDGTALEFDDPKSLFRLRQNPRVSMHSLTTYGIAFDAIEALP